MEQNGDRRHENNLENNNHCHVAPKSCTDVVFQKQHETLKHSISVSENISAPAFKNSIDKQDTERIQSRRQNEQKKKDEEEEREGEGEEEDREDEEREEEELDERGSLLSKLSVEELLLKGKEYRNKKEFELAVGMLSAAVEKRLKEFGGADHETDPEMGILYLEYGDLLLTMAETSNDLFQWDSSGQLQVAAAAKTLTPPLPDVQKPTNNISSSSSASRNNSCIQSGIEKQEESTAITSPSTEPTSDSVSDEQLAWEVLELARMCYEKAINSLYESGDLPLTSTTNENSVTSVKKTVDDAAFVHLRLGDLLLVEEHYKEAQTEFEKIINLLKNANMPQVTYLPATIALAQSQLFQLEAVDAVETFKNALKLVNDYLAEIQHDETLNAQSCENYKATRDDLQIQIEEIEKNIAEGIYEKNPNNNRKESLPETSSLIITPPSATDTLLTRTGVITDTAPVENPFDTPQLTCEVVNLGVVTGKRNVSEVLDARMPKKICTGNDNNVVPDASSNTS